MAAKSCAPNAKTKPKGYKPEFGPDRQPGVAGPQADYIIRSLERWRLRGSGVVK